MPEQGHGRLAPFEGRGACDDAQAVSRSLASIAADWAACFASASAARRSPRCARPFGTVLLSGHLLQPLRREPLGRLCPVPIRLGLSLGSARIAFGAVAAGCQPLTTAAATSISAKAPATVSVFR